MEKSKERSDLIETGCHFWFNDNDRMRSPFPQWMQEQLKSNTEVEFMKYMQGFSQKDREEVTDDELVSTFEMFLFGEALKLIPEEDKDLAITINYPFLPRLGDTAKDEQYGESKVVRRELEERGNKEEKEELKLILIMHLEEISSGEQWASEIQITA